MECIVPGLNLPDDLYYYKDEGVKQLFAKDKNFIEEYDNYDPKGTYFVIFDRFTKIGAVNIWRNPITIFDEKIRNENFALLNTVKATGVLDEEIDFDPNEQTPALKGIH